MNGQPHPLMTTAEVAAAFRVSVMTIHRWRQDGVLTAVTVPGKTGTIRYLRAEVKALLARKPLTAAQVDDLWAALIDGDR